MSSHNRRSGQVLIECLVALVLVAGAAATLDVISIAMTGAADRVAQTESAMIATETARNKWLAYVCSASATPDFDDPVTGRVARSLTFSADGPLHRLSVAVSWRQRAQRRISAAEAPAMIERSHTLTTAARCD